MEIKIIKIKENADGSADVNVHYDKAGLEFLVQQGLMATMVEAIVQYQTGENYNVCDILGTLPKKGSKGRGNQGVAKIKQKRPSGSA
jgi:hypothetical protein